jgi:hypothetical protein
MHERMMMLFVLALIGCVGISGVFTTTATAQVYAECCPDDASLANFEWGFTEPGTTHEVQDGKLRIANINFQWNFFVVDKDVWKGLGSPSDFTIEAKFSDLEKGNKDNVGWLYTIARYAQEDPATYGERLDMIKHTLDEEGGNNGLYLYEWVAGERERPVADSHTRVGEWINDPENFGEESIDITLVVTADTISVLLWGEEELDQHPNASNAGGRPGIAVWSDGGAFSVEFVVYGPGGATAVDPADKIAATWGKIKA